MGKVHVHYHTTKDSNPKVEAAKSECEDAIEAAIRKVAMLKNFLTDSDDRAEAQAAVGFLRNAKGKLVEIVG